MSGHWSAIGLGVGVASVGGGFVGSGSVGGRLVGGWVGGGVGLGVGVDDVGVNPFGRTTTHGGGENGRTNPVHNNAGTKTVSARQANQASNTGSRLNCMH